MLANEVDKRLLERLLSDGRTSLRRIALDIGMSPSLAAYKFKVFLREGIIRRFTTYVDPAWLGYSKAYVMVEPGASLKHYVALFRCIEGYDIYELPLKSPEDLGGLLQELAGTSIKVLMISDKYRNLGRLDRAILRILSKHPRASISQIAGELDVPYATIARRLRRLSGNRVFRIIPVIDLEKSGVSLLSVYTRRKRQVMASLGVFASRIVWDFGSDGEGIVTLFAYTKVEARKIAEAIKTSDPDSIVTIKYEYDFKPPEALL
jgi:DNA-binding Lrp family transcriptional regulator